MLLELAVSHPVVSFGPNHLKINVGRYDAMVLD